MPLFHPRNRERTSARGATKNFIIQSPTREPHDHRIRRLIAGVVHDDVLEQTKGRRPVIPIEERAEIVSHISYVDEVHIETNPDKLHTWSQKPFDVFFKGDDWKGTEKGIALENRFAEVGVRVHYFPYTEHTSSTKLRKVVDLLEAEHDAIEALGRIMRLLDDEQQHGASIKRGLIAQEND